MIKVVRQEEATRKTWTFQISPGGTVSVKQYDEHDGKEVVKWWSMIFGDDTSDDAIPRDMRWNVVKFRDVPLPVDVLEEGLTSARNTIRLKGELEAIRTGQLDLVEDGAKVGQC
ncbi:MAG: hypothetical protein ACAH17_01590 [Candidatus Paceibacterota bacterium]